MHENNDPKNSELGKQSNYEAHYNPQKLYPISRSEKRIEIGIDPTQLPFYGFDCWNHYEVSWLNQKGKPIVAIAEIIYDCKSPKIIESKSMKLYFNSFNNTRFQSAEEVESIIKKDIEQRIEHPALVNVKLLSQLPAIEIDKNFGGECLDHLDIECSIYTPHSEYLCSTDEYVEEILYSDLLKSNCLITKQPDWASVQIQYKGNQIDKEGLLRYIVSFRDHNEFHEQCIERIFADIMKHCQPKELTVYGRYTRRGGLDINPYRSTQKIGSKQQNKRLHRQ
ncbi:MAG: NADPH-dependent 7-cyano-7-deazaguanine reductase QueF [Gammaproteobacteria bacterium]